MRTKLLLVISIFLIIGEMSLMSGQERFVTKPSLSFLSGDRVYSAHQDAGGAMWFYTIDGLIRYNGHSSTSYACPLSKGHFAFNGTDKFYVKSGKELWSMDTSHPDSLIAVPHAGVTVDARTAILSDGDSLFVSDDDKIHIISSGGACLYALTPDSSSVTVLEKTPRGGLAVGTSSGVFLMNQDNVAFSVFTPSSVSGLYIEGDTMLVGLVEGGFFRVDLLTGAVVNFFNDSHGKKMQHVRSFCKAGNGNVYIAASNGLFRLSPDNLLEEILVDGKLSVPVYEVYADTSGNLWVCTVYSGVVYTNLTSCPFSPVSLPQSWTVRGMAQDDSGTIWAATDGHGLFRLSDGVWSLVGGTGGIKYQRLFTIDGMKGVYASDWYGNLLNYYNVHGSTSVTSLNHVSIYDQDNQVTSILWSGDEYLLGTRHGLFAFNPAEESEITREIDCEIHDFNKIAAGRDGRIWLSGNGLASYDDGVFTYLVQPGTRRVFDIDFDEQGTLWGCMGNAVFRVDGSDITIIREFGDVKLLKLTVLPAHRIFCLAEHRTIVYDFDTGGCTTYGEEMGLTLGSTRFSPCLRTSEGHIWIAGANGIEVFDPSKVEPQASAGRIIFDKITAGSRFLWHPEEAAVLDHDENDIVFDFADYDYTGIGDADFEYRLDGFDSEWIALESPSPVSYTNLRPGRYVMRVRSGMSPEDEISCHMRIRPVWYASVPAIVAEILILLSILCYILRSRYAKAVLDEKFRLKNEEYEKQTSFFINLSFKMRTPINLIIGQLEQYFKDYGFRSRGVEDIQEIYKRTKDLRGMISEYVDTQNEALEREPRNARIVNAVLGAIERNLFTKTLNVTLLCDELNMGKTKLTAVVKEATGMSPGEYIEDTRLRYAAEMLGNGNYTVGEVSDRLGFSSPSYFSTRFKKKYGVAPSAWAGSGRLSAFVQNVASDVSPSVEDAAHGVQTREVDLSLIEKGFHDYI